LAPRSGQIQGLPDPDLTLDLVFQAALLCDPTLVLPVPQVCQVGKARVLWVSVPAGLPHVYCLDGRYLGRDGTQTNPLPARRLRQLLLERGVVQFETQSPPNASLDDLDSQKIATYIQALNLPGTEAPEEVLLRRGGLKREEIKDKTDLPKGEVLRPTYAALLLFGKHPQQWFPNATILAARFSGSTLAEQFIKQEIRGTLPEQIRQAEAFVRENLRQVVRMVGLTHHEMLEYPPEALRELLVNAVAHRDYNIQGDNIHLYLFADRIEIHSPGSLPGPVTLDNLLEARFSRNAIIVQTLADLGFVERLRYGLNRVVEVVRQQNLRPPRFEEIAGTFRVTLYGSVEVLQALYPVPRLHELEDVELNPRQQLALSFLSSRRRITNRDYQDLCPDVSAETLRRDLVNLVERGLVVKIGDKRATYYVLKK
jgi:ATP-dependent DNA helicase RecG